MIHGTDPMFDDRNLFLTAMLGVLSLGLRLEGQLIESGAKSARRSATDELSEVEPDAPLVQSLLGLLALSHRLRHLALAAALPETFVAEESASDASRSPSSRVRDLLL